MVCYAQKAVVEKEAHEEQRRESQGLIRGGGPDRRRHRHDVLFPKLPAIALFIEERSQGRPFSALLQEVPGVLVEPQDVPDHAVERRPHQVAALGEHGVQVGAAIFQTGAVAAHTEAHAGRFGLDAEAVQEQDEIRVGHFVINNEAGVHVPGHTFMFHPGGGGMAAWFLPGLEHGDVMVAYGAARR